MFKNLEVGKIVSVIEGFGRVFGKVISNGFDYRGRGIIEVCWNDGVNTSVYVDDPSLTCVGRWFYKDWWK